FLVGLLVVLVFAGGPWMLASAPAVLAPAPAATPSPLAEAPSPPGHVSETAMLRDALLSLAVAGTLGSALAFRPHRRGTPARAPAVIQTQEELFRRQHVRYELPTTSQDDLTYSVELPFTKRTIGGPDSVRGLREQRYSGDASLYGNVELRLRLFNHEGSLPV